MLAQEAQPSDLYPYASKSDTWVQEKIIKKQQKKNFLCLKIQPGSRKELVLLKNSVLEYILIYHLGLKENFFLKK